MNLLADLTGDETRTLRQHEGSRVAVNGVSYSIQVQVQSGSGPLIMRANMKPCPDSVFLAPRECQAAITKITEQRRWFDAA